MTRKMFMVASPGLMLPRCHAACYVRWTIKVLLMIALIVGLGWLAATIGAPTARGTSYCTPQMPYPPYGGVCTGGWGNYCTIGLACSPVPGTPGTSNPNGYTPVVGGWVHDTRIQSPNLVLEANG